MQVTIILYLPEYESIPCINGPPILEPKNTFSLFLGLNFPEKLIFYVRIFFQVHYGTKRKKINLQYCILNFFFISVFDPRLSQGQCLGPMFTL